MHSPSVTLLPPAPRHEVRRARRADSLARAPRPARILGLLIGLLLALTASVVSAGGINLNWNNCSAGASPPPLQDVTFACNTNTGLAGTLFASFEPNVVQNLVAFEFVIDIQSAGSTLPAWWEYKATGACRATSMTMNTNFVTGPFDCVDTWGGTIALQNFSYLIGHHGPSTARISGFGAIAVPEWVVVDVGSEYYCFSLRIDREKTVGLGSCDGCLDPVCLVFNELALYDEVGVRTILSAPATSNYVTWQGHGYQLCVTPTYRATWGRIKSIYR